MVTAPRYLEKFESADATLSYTFPLAAYEWTDEQDIRTAFSRGAGASYGHDHAGTGKAPVEIADDRYRGMAVGTVTETEAEIQNARWICGRIQYGKLFTIDQYGTRRFAWARIESMPPITITGAGNALPLIINFKRETDWMAIGKVRGSINVFRSGIQFTINNPGSTRVKNGVFRLRAKSRLEGSGGLIQDYVVGTFIAREKNIEGDGLAVPAGSIYEGPAATNLFTNGGAETNTTGVAAINGATLLARVTTDFKFGTACFKFHYNGGVNEGINNSVAMAVTGGFAYSGAVWIKATAGDTIYLQYVGNGGGNLVGGPFTGTGAWQEVYVSGLAAGGDTTATLNLLINAGTVADKFVDGIRFTQTAAKVPYIETNGGTAARAAGRLQLRNAREQALHAAILADSPLSYWPGTELAGTAAADKGSLANAGLYVNAPTFDSPASLPIGDEIGGPLYNGTTQYMSAPDLPGYSINTTGQLTLETVFHVTALPAGNATILSKVNTAQFEYLFRIRSDGVLDVIVLNAAGSTQILTISSSIVLSAAKSYHAVIAFDLYGTTTLYINGAAVGTGTFTDPSAYTNGTALFNIGRRGDALEFFNGIVKRAAIYNRALSAADVARHYAAAITGGVVSPTQGWIIAVDVPDWASTAVPSTPAVWEWVDSGATSGLRLGLASGSWTLTSVRGGITSTAGVAASHAVGAQLVHGAFWTDTQVAIGLNGSALTTGVRGGSWATGFGVPQTIDIGSRVGTSLFFHGNFKALYAGCGTMTQAQWQAVYAAAVAGELTTGDILALAPDSIPVVAEQMISAAAGTTYYTAPTIRNNTTKESVLIARAAANIHSEIRLSNSEPSVRYSDNDGADYTADWASVTQPNGQERLIELEPGNNDIQVTDSGAMNASLEYEFYPTYSY